MELTAAGVLEYLSSICLAPGLLGQDALQGDRLRSSGWVASLTVVLAACGPLGLMGCSVLCHSTSETVCGDEEYSIARGQMVVLGGVEQFVSMRGRERNSPILLILHGGPGLSELSYSGPYESLLEERFVVVHWEQRGTGKSYSRRLLPESVSPEQIITDGIELSEKLLRWFGQEKLFLAGQSWGGYLGMRMAHRRPDLFHGAVLTNPLINGAEQEVLAYQYSLEQARKSGNTKALRRLEALGEPPFVGKGWLRKYRIARTWLDHFDGFVYGEQTATDLLGFLLSAPEYGLIDRSRYVKGLLFSTRATRAAILAANLMEEVPEVEIPVYFNVGRHDYTVNYHLVEAYFRQLKAPVKELTWFEHSAHIPNWTEPNRFQRVLIEKLLGPDVLVPVPRAWAEGGPARLCSVAIRVDLPTATPPR